jgi:beta-carotene ketolase (CrtW type)
LSEPPRHPSLASQAQSPLWGLGFAVALITAWIASLLLLLLLPLDVAGPGAAPALVVTVLAAVALRAFLQTGLFIVAHDAMHGSLLPGAPLWNDRIGRLALALYAALPWEVCRRHHRAHHLAPASATDPDHHDGRHRGALAWYGRFMASYLTPTQMATLLGGWLLCLVPLAPHTSHPLARLLLFWTLPLLISSLQLFLIGTYLPHRASRGRSGDRHQAASLAWPTPLSLLACFHFGYHWEHHDHPEIPWYRLPQWRRLVTVPPPGTASLALPARRR